MPEQFTPVNYTCSVPLQLGTEDVKIKSTDTQRELIGVDLFVHYDGERNPQTIAAQVANAVSDEFELQQISNRGTMVWPKAFPETFCTDQWTCRLVLKARKSDDTLNRASIIHLLKKFNDADIDVVKTENLYCINGEKAYAKGQGE